MRFLTIKSGLVVATVALAACAQKPVVTPEPAPQATAAPSKPLPRGYEASSLANLLVAEVAAQRSAYGVTMGYYAEEARTTQDPLVAEQAAKLSSYLNDPALSAEMGQIWLNNDSGSREAHELLALSYIEQGETEKAAEQIDLLMADDPRQALVELVVQARNLDDEGNAQLLAALGSLTERYPDQAPLWYARALNLEIEQRPEQSLVACERAIKLDNQHEDSLLLKARLLYQLERKDEALKFLKQTVRKYPDAKRVRVLYVRLLIETDHLDDAGTQLAELNKRYPEDLDLRLSLALLAMERGDRKQAVSTLNELLDAGFRPDDIRLYLANASEQDGNLQNALDYYMAVQGENQLRARVQASRLMNEQGLDDEASALMNRLRDQHPDQMPNLYAAEAEMLSRSNRPERAMKVLNNALIDLPNNTELLYARAMTAERLDNLPQLEADLSRLLELKPNDPTAMNALGYTLIDRTDRIEEASVYIELAHAARPNDPAVMDSMGWLRFRQGRLDEALPLLKEAWTLFPDQEVAAHLGEVLWALGQQDEARQIWRDGLQRSPDSEAIPAAVLRLTGSEKP
ncbi:MAG: tetratricopeptide repeat protein [Alcanivoracaceae bacterium]|nr:tetratricopeptide repeat protein [Alcanivoracaceae bacterium]